jgi:hypothetical protein
MSPSARQHNNLLLAMQFNLTVNKHKACQIKARALHSLSFSLWEKAGMRIAVEGIEARASCVELSRLKRVVTNLKRKNAAARIAACGKIIWRMPLDSRWKTHRSKWQH